MTISSIQVYRPGIGLLPAQDGERLKVTYGDVIRVTSTFKYRQPEGFTCRVIAYIGTYASRGITQTVTHTLPPAVNFTLFTSYNDLTIKKKGVLPGEGVVAGIYNLGVHIPEGGDAYYEIPTCIEVVEAAGMLDTLGSMLPLIMIMMMMGMMMNVMGED